MKNTNQKTGFTRLALVLFVAALLFNNPSATAQATWPYDVCNNKNVSIDVICYIAGPSGGPAAQWNAVIPPSGCLTIPNQHFLAVGHVASAFDCEVEVVVVAINTVPYNACIGSPPSGDEPICSSVAPSGFPCNCPVGINEKCCSCFGTAPPLTGMAWTPQRCDLY